MRASRILREQGSRDMRLLIITLCAWATMVVTKWILNTIEQPTQCITPVMAIISVLIVSVLITLIVMRRRGTAYVQRAIYGSALGTVCIAVMVICMISTWCHWLVYTQDVLVQATQEHSVQGVFDVMVSEPALRSTHDDYACTVRVRVNRVHVGQVHAQSSQQATMQLERDSCNSMKQHMRIQVQGRAGRAIWNPQLIMLTVNQPIHVIQPAPAVWQLIHHMRERFFVITQSLDDHSRVLVPGITLGILGQDMYCASCRSGMIDDTYATTLTNQCKQAGIMHIMAVSGGHYALLAAVCTQLAARMRARPWMLALMQISAYWALTLILMPSESVTRAVWMGIFRLGYVLCGRIAQTLHALCWTTLLALIMQPDRAEHLGFALSCSALLGIALLARPLQTRLQYWMPSSLASALAMTISAQCCTLPVQLILQPSIPIWSIPANLMITPCMDAATICGLLACMLSIVWPLGASWCAHLAGWCTTPIELAAQWFGSQEHATLPWVSGITGICLMILTECVVFALIAAITLLYRTVRIMRPDYHAPSMYQRLQWWWHDTRNMMHAMQWKTRE